MSYDTECSAGCTRVALISNPNVDFSCGDAGADERDNARAALTVDNVAAYN